MEEGRTSISCLFSDGRRHCRDLAGTGPAALVADLLTGLAAMIHPHGSIDLLATMDRYLRDQYQRSGRVHDEVCGHDGGAAQLPRAPLAEFWMGAARWRETATRRMLTSFDMVSGGGPFQPGVRAPAAGLHFGSTGPPGSPLAPYDQQEWEQLHQACLRVTDEAFAGHQQALKSAASGEDPADRRMDRR